MAQNYIDLGYNFLLGLDEEIDDSDGINARNADQIFEDHSVSFDFTSMQQLNPSQNMQSENFVSGLTGWKIYGDGFAEFVGLTLTGGLINYQKTSFTDSSVSGYYISSQGLYFGSVADATIFKFDIGTGKLEYKGLLSGLNSDRVAEAISTSGNLQTDVINSRLNTQTEEILGDYDFGSSGSLAMANDANNGIWLSPSGILGKKAGATTFAITTSGDATFAGEMVAAYGTFGTVTAGVLRGSLIIGNGTLTAVTLGAAIDAATGNLLNDIVNLRLNTATRTILGSFEFGPSGAIQIGTYSAGVSGDVRISPNGIVGRNKSNAITFAIDGTTGDAIFAGNLSAAGGTFAGTLTAVSGTFGTITAGDLSGVTVTGSIIRTANNPTRVELSTTNLRGYVSGARRVQMDEDSLEFWSSSSYKTVEILSGGDINIYKGDAGETLLGSISTISGPPTNGIVIEGTETVVITAKTGSLVGIDFNARDTSLRPMAKLSYDGSNTLFDLTYQSSSRLKTGYVQLASGGYANWGSTIGSSGYGLRDNSGIIEYKNSAGAWAPFASGGLPAGVTLNMMYFDGLNWGNTTTVYVGGFSGSNLSWQTTTANRIHSGTNFSANGNIHATGSLYTGGIGGMAGIVHTNEVKTEGNDLLIRTNRNMTLRAYSGSYNLNLGEGTLYDWNNINAYFTTDFNFFQNGTAKCIIDDNIWGAGGIQVVSYVTAGGTIQNSVGDIICSTGNLQLLRTGAVLAVTDASGTTHNLTCKLNPTTGTYILTT